MKQTLAPSGVASARFMESRCRGPSVSRRGSGLEGLLVVAPAVYDDDRMIRAATSSLVRAVVSALVTLHDRAWRQDRATGRDRAALQELDTDELRRRLEGNRRRVAAIKSSDAEARILRENELVLSILRERGGLGS